MDIRRKADSTQGNIKGAQARPLSVILDVQGGKLEIEPGKIKEVCLRFAEIAYSLGETNDVSSYASEMEETLYGAYKKAEKKQEQKKKKNS